MVAAGMFTAQPRSMAEVYALMCPDSGAFRYIGMTSRSAMTRFRSHIGPDALGPVRDWVAALRAAGKCPELRVIATGMTYREALALERQLIATTKGLINRPAGPKSPARRPVQYDSDVMGGVNMLKWWKSRTNLPHL